MMHICTKSATFALWRILKTKNIFIVLRFDYALVFAIYMFLELLNSNLMSDFQNFQWRIQYSRPKRKKLIFLTILDTRGILKSPNSNLMSDFQNSKCRIQYGSWKFEKYLDVYKNRYLVVY